MLFYWFDKFAETNPSLQTRGMVLLRIVTEPRFSRKKMGDAMAILEKAVPIKIKVFRMLCVPPPGAKHMFEKTVMPIFQKLHVEVWGDRVKIHVASSPGHLMRQMKAAGLRRSGVPVCCGGKWKYDKWDTLVARKDPPLKSIPTKTDEQEPSKQKTIDQKGTLASKSPREDRKRAPQALNDIENNPSWI
jgi:hypothetical protein